MEIMEQRQPVTSLFISIALAASTRSVRSARCVLICVFMSALAPISGQAQGQGSVSPRFVVGDSAMHVLGVRDSFQVLRVDAAPYPAFVVNLQAHRDWSDEMLVSKPMRSDHLPMLSNTEEPISLWAHPSQPKPAAAVWLGTHKIQKSFNRSKLLGSHVISPESHRSGPRDVEASLRPASILSIAARTRITQEHQITCPHSLYRQSHPTTLSFISAVPPARRPTSSKPASATSSLPG